MTKPIREQYKYDPWTSPRCPSARQIGYLFERMRTYLDGIGTKGSNEMIYLINRYGCMISKRRYHLDHKESKK